jgi:heparan-sulfate lyase
MQPASLEHLFRAEGNPDTGPFELIGSPLTEEELFLVLDLSRPGLERVQLAVENGDNVCAAEELLTYYRQRTHVVWTTWPAAQSFLGYGAEREDKSGGGRTPRLEATEDDFRVAEDAIRHIFQPYVGYPPWDYGPDIDWDADPYRDPNDPHPCLEWPVHMHLMHSWDLAVTRCYSSTGDERYARIWVELTEDWIRKNPLTKERCYFPASWHGNRTGIRGTRWSGLLPYYLDSPACLPQFLVTLLTSLYNHARKMMLIPFPKVHNFGISESVGLADIALTFPEFADASWWRQTAFSRLAKAMQEQVLPDGMHGELSPGYHIGMANQVLQVAETALCNGFDPPFKACLERMAEVVLGLMTPTRSLPIVGDAWPSDVRPFLERAGRLFGRADFLAAATDGAQGAWPTKRHYAFSRSGFYAFRSDWGRDALWMCLHCGPPSIAPPGFHAQFDNGTFELMAGGRYLMRDPGVYSYAPNHPDREAFRRTAAHQTLTLDGRNSAREGHLLQWVEDDGQGNAILSVANRSYPYLVHRRTVFFVASRWFVLVDEALGQASGILELHFQLAPGPAQLDSAQKTVRTAWSDGPNVLVWADREAPVVLEEEEAWFSPQHHQKEPMPAFRYRHLRSAPARFLTVLVPWQSGSPPVISAKIIGGEIGGDTLEVALTVDGVAYILQRNLAQTL